ADLVILDIAMPEMSGWEVCKAIKENPHTKHIPVLMFTVMTRDEDVTKSFECGADAHLKKPFTMAELIEAVERLLERSRG
ncbi:MAG: response regulator, partial [Euryarchaeota archaeon]|nr:response regulator [Euryarchaeota archaeon]